MRRVCSSRPRTTLGFTLIEVIMTLVLLGIIASLGVGMMGDSILAYFAGRDLLEADWRGRAAIERMTRELRSVRSASAADLNIATLGQIRFNDKSGTGVCFYLAGTTLMRSADFATACGTTNPQPLAGSVAGLGFVYYQNNGVTVAPPASPNLVRYIATQFTVTFGGANTAYRATVTMRPL
ncbi:MAG TPA: prepilin-type N-terminal cleavage/methylation domain-containing protein [Acidiferrobacterales bacterium]|nr:prepilin-type N-terminal cleavage/methylation domain-containing protein [Acidiferrobacterales bacterium]